MSKTLQERARVRARMQKVGQKNTKPELAVRKILRGLDPTYRIHAVELPGKPDIVYRPNKLAIFVHGCFWHGHAKCRRGSAPSVRRDFWIPKLRATRARDEDHIRELRKIGWKTFVVWECALRRPETVTKRLSQFLLRSGRKIKTKIGIRNSPK